MTVTLQRLLWLAVEKPWSALSEPSFSFFAKIGIEKTLLSPFGGSISGIVGSAFSVQERSLVEGL